MEASPSKTTTAKSLLRQAMDRLAQRDFISCQKLAAEALDSDPVLAAAAAGILAVAGVLLPGDLYAVLKLTRAEAEDSQLVWARFERLAETLARPELNDIALAQEAYERAFEAWSVLSDSRRKSRYDAEAGEAETASFWTLCPYCFWMFQYGKVYEECCLRCQNCSRAFHGVAIAEPPSEIVVPGKDEYFLWYGVFPLGYKAKPDANADEREGDSGRGGGSGKRWRVAKMPARRMRNVKAVAKKMKKAMPGESESESEKEKEKEKENNNGGGGGGNLVFYEGDGDVYVGLEDIS